MLIHRLTETFSKSSGFCRRNGDRSQMKEGVNKIHSYLLFSEPGYQHINTGTIGIDAGRDAV